MEHLWELKNTLAELKKKSDAEQIDVIANYINDRAKEYLSDRKKLQAEITRLKQEVSFLVDSRCTNEEAAKAIIEHQHEELCIAQGHINTYKNSALKMSGLVQSGLNLFLESQVEIHELKRGYNTGTKKRKK